MSHDIRRLDRKLAHGVSWTGGIKGLAQLVNWASTIVVARLLSPEDFGLVAMATLYLGMTALVTEFGLGAAIVALRDLTDDVLAQLHSVALLMGLAAFAVSCAVAYPLSGFFGAPELTPVVVVLSCSLVLDSLRTVPTALLARALRFKALALLDAFKPLASVAITIVLAALGARYWALVFGNVLATVIITTVLLALRPQRFARPRFGTVKPTLTFSLKLVVGHLAWYGYSNADFLIAGRVLGKVPLGEYTLAWTMSTTPGDKVIAIFGRVIPTAFAAVKHDIEALRRYFLLFTEGMATLIVPTSVGLALVAREFVPLAFGTKWLPAVLPLQLLCCYLTVHVLAVLLVHVLNVMGAAKYPMRVSLYALAVLPPAFYLAGTNWGTAGIAGVWLVAYPVILLPLYLRVFRTLHIRLSEYLAYLAPTLGSAAVMTSVVFAIRVLLPADWSLALRFGAEVGAGAAAYLAVWLGLQRKRLQTLTDFFRAVRSSSD